MKQFLLSIVILLLMSASGLCAEGKEEVLAPRYQEILRQLVEVNTGTGNKQGLDRAREILIPEFRKLGFDVARQKTPKGNTVLIFDFPGATPEIILIGHLDTVFPPSGGFNSFARSGDRISGPGVIDMKGGIVLMLNILEELQGPEVLQKIRVVLNDDEETGSLESKGVIRKAASGCKYGLIFEPGLGDGAVVGAQAGVRWLQLKISGKAAHAGLEPENGIDACLELSRKLVAIAAMSGFSKRLTINPGVVTGGTKANVVCDNASALLDIRYVDEGDLEIALAGIKKIADTSFVYNERLKQGTTATLSEIASMPNLPPGDTAQLAKRVTALAGKLGQTVTARSVGYGSDGNHLAGSGLQLLVGLGPYGGGMHTDREYMLASAYLERLTLDRALIAELLKGGK